MTKILLKNGHIVDQNNNRKKVDILLENHLIELIDSEIVPDKNQDVIDLKEKLVIPGLIDMQVHLREPGGEQKETIESGLKAAVKGGFTTVAAMPNTNPVMDNPAKIESLRSKAERLNICHVIPIPAMTEQMMQKKLADYGDYRACGVGAITDDGRGVADDGLMEQIFEQAAHYKLSVLQHCEFSRLSKGGSYHQGERASQLGVKGISSESEYKMIARDIDLLRKFGGHYHVLHLSTREGVELVAQAKAEGLHITAEVTPHHLVLCDSDIPTVDANFKMNPPLRTRQDQAALIEGVCSGIIDMVSSDHAPHTELEKSRPIEEAPFGVVGLETAFALLYTELVLKDKISLFKLIDLMSKRPAEIFGLSGGVIRVGEPANLTIIDEQNLKMVDPEDFVSKGRNTPFAGRCLRGWPVRTFFQGRQVWKSESL